VTELTPAERAQLQRRVLRVLTGGQIVGSAGLAAAVTVGAFVIQGILGAQTPLSGLATAMVTMGTAFASQVLARKMRRQGRRPGLQLGYAVAIVGGLVAAAGAEWSLLPVFLLGLFLFGNGQAANLLARYAATDLAEPDERARAMSRIVFASTFGAVLGPLIIGPAEHAGQSWFGLHKYTGPWLFGASIYVLALANTALRLRPDPLVVAGGVGLTDVARPSLRRTYASILAGPRSRLALLAMVISHVTMVGVMTMTPVHMKLHGHEGLSQYVVSLHIAGMYAFAPLVGRFADRRGRVPAILTGGVVLVFATLLAALSGEATFFLFPALWALGLGWNFGLIGGSSLLVESMPADQRVTVQGAADMAMSFCGGIAGFSSGFIRRAVGYHLLAAFAMAIAGGLLVIAYTAWLQSRRPVPMATAA
jgi:MFS family permease